MSRVRAVRPTVSGVIDDAPVSFGLTKPSDMRAQRENKRQRTVGTLLPSILFNEASTEITSGGKHLEELIADDSYSDLLLVIGTSLRTDGIARLVKLLAGGVHAAGGAVIYVNRDSLSARTWGQFIDLHLQTDIEDWSRELLSMSLQVRILS